MTILGEVVKVNRGFLPKGQAFFEQGAFTWQAEAELALENMPDYTVFPVTDGGTDPFAVSPVLR